MAIRKATFEAQFAAATRRGEERLRREPCAIAARYDRQRRVVIVDLDSGCSLLVPPEFAQGLSDASADQLGQISILGPGTTISWPKLDVQFSVAGLLAGMLGTRAWMAALGRRSKSPAKSRRVSRNGAKRARPRTAKRNAY